MGSCWSINVGAKLEAFMETMWKEQAALVLSPSALLQCLYSCSSEGDIYLIISSAGCWCRETTDVLDFGTVNTLERSLG